MADHPATQWKSDVCSVRGRADSSDRATVTGSRTAPVISRPGLAGRAGGLDEPPKRGNPSSFRCPGGNCVVRSSNLMSEPPYANPIYTVPYIYVSTAGGAVNPPRGWVRGNGLRRGGGRRPPGGRLPGSRS